MSEDKIKNKKIELPINFPKTSQKLPEQKVTGEYPENTIILYQDGNANITINVIYKNETFWLTQKAMAVLFECSSDNISLHLKSIYKEQELQESTTTEDSSVVQKEGFVLNEEMLKNGKPFGQDCVNAVNSFLKNNNRKVLEGKGKITHEKAVEKVHKEYEVFRIRQDKEYISEFDRQMQKIEGKQNSVESEK